ncbi:ATP-binding protein [Desulfospira joergensenii]|uniref:ATP-binding protein n=1 Tax=Desulfospira joergensenii TaxID=53329 RepID=UPI0003B586E8|nr:ATP-binding protein [Desulfospira joergensenii]
MGKVNVSIRVRNRLEDLCKIKDAVAEVVSSASCTKRKFKEIDLVLEELFANVVHHGFMDDKEHEINLALYREDDMLIIRMEDDGRPFNIMEAESADIRCPIENRRIGGLGIQFVKHFTDHCEYRRENHKNIVILKKQIVEDPNPKTCLIDKE